MKIPQQNQKLIQYVLLFILSFGLYANTLNHEWASDDMMLITDNTYTKEGWEGIKKIWTKDSFAGFLGEDKNLLPGGRYRPLSQTVFNIQYSIMGENNPFIGHLTNVLLFPLAILLLFRFLSSLFRRLEGQKGFFNLAFISSLIAAFHPLNTEVVANVKSLDLILSMLFATGTLALSLRYTERKNVIYLPLILVLFVLGTLAKEWVATLFLLVPVTVLFFRKEALRSTIPVMVSLSLGVVAYGLIRYQAIGIGNEGVVVKELLNDPFLEASTSEKFATIFYTWFVYLKLLVFPHPLTHDYYPYHIALTKWSNPATLFALLFFISMAIWSAIHMFKLLTQKEEKPNIYLYGFLFFLITFSVSSNLAFNVGAFMNERFIFFSSIGFAMALAYGIQQLGKKTGNAKLIPILLVVLLLPYGGKTLTRNQVWENDFTLFTTDVKVSKNSAKCNVSAGGKLYETAMTLEGNAKKKMLAESRKYLVQGLSIHPKNFQAWILVGNVAFEQKDYTYGAFSYQNCLKLSPANAMALSNLKIHANNAHAHKDYTECIKLYKLLPDSSKSSEMARYQIADCYLTTQQVDTAQRLLMELIKDYPESADGYNKLGELFGRYKGDLNNSERYLRKALEINPDNHSVLENLGVLMGMKGQADQSLEYLLKALEAGGQKKQLYQNLALTYRLKGQEDQAKEYDQKANALGK